MFRGSYQRKLLTILYSGGSNPLEIWDIQVKNGWTRRVKDDDLGAIVFEIAGTNVATAYIVSPPNPRGVLAISLSFITMFIKNLKKYFTFEIQILDDKQMRRRFRFSNYQSSTKVRPFACSVPLALKPGWNQMQLNLANFTMRAYGTNYVETQRVQVHANCRIRRIYFSDRLYADEELPRDYRIYLNVRQAPRPERPSVAPAPSPDILSNHDSVQEILKPGPSCILKQPSKVGNVTIAETLVSETSFKSGPSATDQRTSKSDSITAERTSIASVQKSDATDKSTQEAAGRVESVISKKSSRKSLSIDKNAELAKSVTFDQSEQEEYDTLEGGEAVHEELGHDDHESTVEGVVLEPLEEVLPEQSPLESESEPIPESDAEEPVEDQAAADPEVAEPEISQEQTDGAETHDDA